jgi:putative nucleotidyltransferase with HDIG domain
MKRVLFVDDEPNILQGLRRMLRPMRDEWQMDFAGSGQEALDLLALHPADVVVTDMRMPEMDGATLLEHLVERHPRIVRIVLSGHAERGSLMRAAALAHQYLSKPCDPEVLREKIAQAFALGTLLSDSRLNEVASRLTMLPALSGAYRDVLAELQSEDPCCVRLAAMIERDLSMTAKLLQLANSSFFGQGARVCRCSDAVELLGMETVRGLVLSMQVFLRLEQDAHAYDVGALTRHSARVSRCAQAIARAEGAAVPVVAAGLLHDIGKLVLADALGAEYTATLRQRFGGAETVWLIERETFSASHAEVGAYLLGLWGLPPAVIAATAWHHRPSQSTQQGFTVLTAVHAGNVIAHRIERERNTDRPVEPPDDAYLEGLGLAARLPLWHELCSALEEAHA